MSDGLDYLESTASQFQGAALSYGIQAKNAKKAYKYTKQLQDAQNQFNVEMWNKQNEYNLPSNQVQRLRDAGVNPAIAFSQGVNSGISTNLPSSGSGSFNMPSMSSVESVVQNMSALAQQDLMGKQGKNVGIDTLNRELMYSLNEKGKAYLFRALQGRSLYDEGLPDLLKANQSLALQQVQQSMQETALLSIQTNCQQKQYDWMDKQFKADIALKAAQAWSSYCSGKANLAQVKLLCEQAITEGTKRYLMRHEADYYDKAGNNQQAQADWTIDNRLNGGSNPHSLADIDERKQKAIIKYTNDYFRDSKNRDPMEIFDMITRGIMNVGVGVGSAIRGTGTVPQVGHNILGGSWTDGRS